MLSHQPLTRRRYFMKTFLIVQIPLVILALNPCLTNERKGINEDPNFIILFTDDQRYDALGFAGNPLISTPNLDSVCRAGYYFSQACVATSICSPSRAALLTGRYGSANGVVSVGRNVGLNPGEITLFQYLKDQQYLTGLVGKWHLENKPDACGFGFTAFFEGNDTYYGREFMTNGSIDTATGFIEEYNVDQSIIFMRSAIREVRPFALFHCTQVPHMDHTYDWDVRDSTQEIYSRRSLEPPVSWKDDLEGKPEYLSGSRSRQRALYYGYNDRDSLVNHLERYYASITELDASLGRLFSFLRDNDLGKNTYIIFMSDNGWFLGDHNFTSKVLAYEESMRVPFCITGPGISQGKSDALVLNIDIAPTVLELAGMEVPENMQGASLVPIVKGELKEVRDEIFYEAPESNLGSYPLFAIRTKEWKYIQTYDNRDPSRLIFEEIYHLTDDPYEMNNLAGDEKGREMIKLFSGKANKYRDGLRGN
jgi:arylsulfatase A-like enzyme